jgi:hypothetical protein
MHLVLGGDCFKLIVRLLGGNIGTPIYLTRIRLQVRDVLEHVPIVVVDYYVVHCRTHWLVNDTRISVFVVI